MTTTTKQEAARQLMLWLLNHHPDLFLAAYHEAKFGKSPTVSPALGDISDFLSGLGDSISSAVGSLTDWATSKDGLTTLAGLGTAYLTTQAQQNALQTQIARTQASKPPLAITYTTQGNPVVGVTAAGTPATMATPPQAIASYVPATQQFLAQYVPSNWEPYVIGAAVVVGAFFLLRMIRG